MISTIIGIKESSQRVHNKNFKILNGKPLYSWILDTLIGLKQVEEIILNVQGNLLMEKISNDYSNIQKVKIISRNKALEGHTTPMTDIIESSLEHASFDDIINTHVTNPFLSKNTLSVAIEKYYNFKKPIFSVNTIQSRLYDENLLPLNHDPQNLLQTQDLNKIYEENSCFYIFNKQKFLKKKTRVFQDSTFFPISKVESVDIDTMEDWELAEIISRGVK